VKKKPPLRVEELRKLKAIKTNTNKTNTDNNQKEEETMNQVLNANLWVLTNEGNNNVRLSEFTGNEKDIFMLISEKSYAKALVSAERTATMKGMTLLTDN
jgi:hypothetical protein